MAPVWITIKTFTSIRKLILSIRGRAPVLEWSPTISRVTRFHAGDMQHHRFGNRMRRDPDTENLAAPTRAPAADKTKRDSDVAILCKLS
jgi:hypothetical protein